MTDKDSTRATVLKLLRTGNVTITEAARLSGESAQLVTYWARTAGLDVAASREARLARIWERIAG
jgi:hypothetical protein